MIEVVCGIIENSRGEFLACRRPQGRHLGGRWEFPGGKLDPGESPESALIRELREELSIEVEVQSPLARVIWHYDEVTICLIPFRCRITTGEIHPTEHDQVIWCDPGKFHQLDWAAADLPVLREIEVSLKR
jgi:8-oxo-dGTP diphosphatase